MNEHEVLLSALLGALVERLGGEVRVSPNEIEALVGYGLDIWRDPAGDAIKVAVYRGPVLQ